MKGWECCKHRSCSAPMVMNMQECIRYFLGIDGGGTKTALLLKDREGTVLRELCADACNPMDIGFERAQAVLRSAIDDICAGIDLSETAMFAGIAGGGSLSARQTLAAFFADFGFGVFDCGGDNRNILEAGLGSRDGICAILGTGICVQAKHGDTLHRIGGWGYFIDRGGSGFNLGRDALDAYYSAHDGSGPDTLLTSLIEEKTQCSPEALVSRIYAGGKTFVASFAPLVTEAARRGDRMALSILDTNAHCIARLIFAAENRLPAEMNTVPVVLCGGLSKEPEIVSRLERFLSSHPRLTIECMTCEPVWGAAMAAQKLGKAEESSC